jgi:Tol biopolymer transport system component
MDLWQQRISREGQPDGGASIVTVGIGMQYATFTRDGGRLAYSKGRHVANIWRVPILDDRPAVWADAEQLTFDQANIGSLDLLRDGEHLLVNSDRSGNQNIWIVPVHGSDIKQITSDRVPQHTPRCRRMDSGSRFSPKREGTGTSGWFRWTADLRFS